MHTVKWFQVLLLNTNSSIYTQINGSEYSKWLNSSIWPIEETLTDAPIPGESQLGSNGNEGVLHIPKSPRIEALSSDSLASYPGYSLGRGSYPLDRDAVSIFYSPSWLSWEDFTINWYLQNVNPPQVISCL